MIQPARHTPVSQRFTAQGNEPPATPIERLFRAVIDEAFKDAAVLPKIWYRRGTDRHLATTRQRLQDEARRWLLSGGQDFILICDLAGRDPAEVQEKARRLLGNPEFIATYAAAQRVGTPRYRGPKERPA